MSIDWGSVPDWLAGAGAVTALIFAAAAVRVNRETNRGQAQQIKKLEEDQERRESERRAEQATKVAVWVSAHSADGEADLPLVRLVNSSSLPVYTLLLTCNSPLGTVEKVYTAVGPRNDRRVMTDISRKLQEQLAGLNFTELHDRGLVSVGCSFRDSAGEWWYRTHSGSLHSTDGRAKAEAGARSGSPGAG